ncbi:MAG: restriction endonuclease subunit S [Pseudomonadota bacterium]|nr:restriction endonuclease subunit S [Pseudomonadota bacterium]
MGFDSCTPVELITDGTPITYGVVQPGPEDKNGVLFIRGGDISDGRIKISNLRTISRELSHQYKRTLLKGGELVISLVGNPGEVAIVPDALKGANIARQVGLVRVDQNRFHPKFVQYYLMSPAGKAQLFSYSLGSVQSVINLKELRRVEIPNFPLNIQEEIVKCLGDIDDKIDLNRRINQTLEAMAQAIFKSWFVDFDPVKAKIAAIQEGRDPLRAAMRAISGKTDAELDQMPREHHDQLAATAALFPDAMQESELGEIPKRWSCGGLGDICSFTAGSAFKPEHQGSAEGDYPFIKVSDMNLAGNEVFIQSANNYVSKAQQSEMKAKLHPLGATVFAKIGIALISNRRRLLTSPTIIDNNLMSASPAEGKSGQYFLYSMLSTIDFNTLVSGTALPYLNVSDLKKIPIVRPPRDVGCAFERKASSIFSMMQELAKQSSTLADTRDNLLPKLLSGAIELSEALEK